MKSRLITKIFSLFISVIVSISVGKWSLSAPRLFDKEVSVPASSVPKIEILYDDEAGSPFGSFRRLSEYLGSKKIASVAMINGGMVHRDGAPVGLLVVRGQVKHGINVETGDGNFFMGKKGVFGLKNGRAFIVEAEPGLSINEYEYATQSGPLLVQHGAIVAGKDWLNRKSRSAVGISPDGSVTFVQCASIGLYQLAEGGKEAGFNDMLYLDGGGYDLVARDPSEFNTIRNYAGIIVVKR